MSGEVIYEQGTFVTGYGERRRTGRFLRFGEPRGSILPPADIPDTVAVAK